MSSFQPIVLVFAAVPMGLLLLFGTAALCLRKTVWATVCEVIAHGSFALGLLMNFYFIIPRFKRMVEDFGTELSARTRVVISISDLTVNYWYVFLFLILAGSVVDAVGFATFHRTQESRYVARTFSVVITLTLLVHAAFAVNAVLTSQALLLQNLR